MSGDGDLGELNLDKKKKKKKKAAVVDMVCLLVRCLALTCGSFGKC